MCEPERRGDVRFGRGVWTFHDEDGREVETAWEPPDDDDEDNDAE